MEVVRGVRVRMQLVRRSKPGRGADMGRCGLCGVVKGLASWWAGSEDIWGVSSTSFGRAARVSSGGVYTISELAVVWSLSWGRLRLGWRTIYSTLT